jgi:glutamine synthetase
VQRVLGEDAFTRFIENPRKEWEDYRVQVTPFEIEQFLPVL